VKSVEQRDTIATRVSRSVVVQSLAEVFEAGDSSD
jgi:hypothetical protein